MEEKLNLNFEANNLQMNLVDLIMQSNLLKEKYEKRKNLIKFSLFDIDKIEENKYYKQSQSNLEELKTKFEEFKNEKTQETKLDMFKTLEDEFEFLKDDLDIVISFEGIDLEEEIFVFNYVKLLFIEKTAELITKIILELE